MDLIVVKFGGMSLGDGLRIKNAAKSVVNEYMKGNQIAVVASAANKTVEELIEADLSDRQKAEIMAMGELTSARLFSSAIESLGVKSEFIDPYNELWPIMTDSNLLNAKIDLKTTNKKAGGIKELLNQGIVPVICGFLGKDPDGEITTLEMGGSDITTFLMGRYLKASEVIFVTDVDGVMSTDPEKIEDAELLSEISAEELVDLTALSVQVIHPRALAYKDPSISAKIINSKYNDLSVNGTRITGPSDDNSFKSVTLYENPVSLIAVVGAGIPEKSVRLAKVTSSLAENDINILGISAGHDSLTVFVEKAQSDKAYHILHNVVIENNSFSSLSLGDDASMIIIAGSNFAGETQGIISDITEELQKNGIRIIEISSSQTTIILYVDSENGKKAADLLSEVFEE
ncbi:aspartate kinase [Methanobrevibacter millerae]|uniref:Aspartokinase n=1 Tax=Methanobrevibacter millerae TaxID=230361 RepID=A0A1G5VBU0_9EURY|nr:aspartate kinase [Methanobrevibacter millerae]SDA42495.1 aspartate kinase [Methanobrevibacter millerae]